jgi:hypothetical protein
MPVRRARSLAATALAFLLGCGGSDGGGGGGTTISGFVLDGFGQPLANRTVLIGNGSATTSANGQFSISGVTAPYDAIILEPPPAKVATVYSQLTRTDPKLLDLGADTQTARSATLGGNIVGGDAFPTPSGELSAVSYGAPEISTGAYVNATPYSFDVGWSGATSITGAVHGLQWTVDSNGTVTGYRSHGVKTGVSLTAGGAVTNADLVLTAVLEDPVSTTISVPAGHEIAQRDVYLSFDDQAYFPVSHDLLDAGALTVPMPSGIGAKANVSASAATAAGTSITSAQITGVNPGTTGAVLALPAPAVATVPANGATGVDTSTELVWTPVTGGIHVVVLSGAANDPAYLIASGSTRVRIPDLSARGLGLPSGRPYDFLLFGLGPYASLDALTETGVFPREGVGFQTLTRTRFTTR